jgi:hypothetical protein
MHWIVHSERARNDPTLRRVCRPPYKGICLAADVGAVLANKQIPPSFFNAFLRT